MKLVIPFTAFTNMPDSLIDSRKEVRKSPIEPVTFKTPPPRPVRLLNNFEIPTIRVLTKSTPMPITENNPLKVDLSFSDSSLLSLILAVISLIFSVMSYNCCAVVGGNTSRKASLTGSIILIIPSKALRRDSIKAVRPPKFFHPCSSSLRAFAESPMIPLNVSLISVRSSLASSKSPTIISQL